MGGEGSRKAEPSSDYRSVPAEPSRREASRINRSASCVRLSPTTCSNRSLPIRKSIAACPSGQVPTSGLLPDSSG